jgi:hypothetical protein
MPQSFTKITQESFNWTGLASNIDTTGGVDTMKILSRYADKVNTHPAIENFDSINMGLTPIYAMDDNAGVRYAQQIDLTTLGGTSRDPYDRYVWSGEVQTDSSNSSIFTHTDIDGVETDGCMYVPDPYFKHAGQYETDAQGNSNQAGISINLQFNSLAAYQWVPLFGIYFGRYGTTDTTFSGQNWDLQYGVSYADAPSFPHCAAADANNLYGESSLRTPSYHYQNGIQWWIWCHDGAGNAMLATTLGEHTTDDDQLFPTYPTNEHYNSSNGYMKFAAPYYLRDWVATQTNPLQSLWEAHGGNGSGVNSYSTGAGFIDYRVYGTSYSYQSALYHDTTGVCTGGNSSHYSQFSNAQLVAYGATSNADLSTPTNLYITVNKTTQDNSYTQVCDGWHFGSGGDSYHKHVQQFVTGKIGDFTFMQVPGVIGDGGSYNGQNSFAHPTGLALRPTVLGDGQINSFAYGSFHPSPHPGNALIPAGNSLAGYFAPGSNIEYIYPTEGGSYDPVESASNSTALLVDAAGVQMSTKTSPSFESVDFLLDNVLSTYTTIKTAGASEALYITLNTAPAVMALNDADPVNYR